MIKIIGIKIEQPAQVVGPRDAATVAEGHYFFCLGGFDPGLDFFVFALGQWRPADGLMDVDGPVVLFDIAVDADLLVSHDASEVFQGQSGELSCSQMELGTMERHPAGEMLSPDIERRTVGWPAASWLGSFAAAAEYWPRRSLGDTRGFVQGRSDLSGAHGQKIGPFAAGVLAHFLGEFFSGFIDSG